MVDVVIEGADGADAPAAPSMADMLALMEAARVQGEERGAALQLLSDRLALCEAALTETRGVADSAISQATMLQEDLARRDERIAALEELQLATVTRLDETIALLEMEEPDMAPEGEGEGATGDTGEGEGEGATGATGGTGEGEGATGATGEETPDPAKDQPKRKRHYVT